jgi:hypothetical protein
MFQRTSHGGLDSVQLYIERQKAMDSVDTRIDEFRAKCNELVETYNTLVHELANTENNIVKRQLKKKISTILGELDIVRDLEDNLIKFRYNYT